jgi:hypothetical protein
MNLMGLYDKSSKINCSIICCPLSGRCLLPLLLSIVGARAAMACLRESYLLCQPALPTNFRLLD